MDSAKQASYLENSINSIPANVKVTKFNLLGDGPKLFVFAARKEIIIRPQLLHRKGLFYR